MNQLVASLLVIVGTTGATAQDRLNIGAEVKLRALHTYDSNLFLTRDDRSDEFTTYAVNFAAALDYSTLRIGAEVDIEDKHYNRFNDQNDTSYDLKTHASLEDTLFRCRLFSQSNHTIAPIDSTFTTRAERDTQRVEATIEATPAYLFGVILSGGYEDRRFIGFDDYEYMKTNASISIYGMYDRETQVGLRLYRGDHDYDNDIRYDAIITRTTVFSECNLSSVLSTQAELGYETFKFYPPSWEDPTVQTASGRYGAASLKYIPSIMWELTGQIKRGVSISYAPSSNYNKIFETNLSITYRPISRVRIMARTYFTHTNEALKLSNDTYRAELNMAYALSEWSELGFTYDYVERIAEDPDGDYVRQLVSVGLTLRW